MVRATRAVMLASALLLAATAAGAQSILVVLRETVNAAPSAPPLAVREGLAATLFDAGVIVMDAPGVAAAPQAELLRTASAAGADFLLTVMADFTSASSDAPLVQAHVAYTIVSVASGANVSTGTLDATNKGRERSVNRTALGAEVGAALAAKVVSATESAG